MQKIMRILQIILVIIIASAIYLIVQHKSENHAEQKQYETLQTNYVQNGIRPQFEALNEINPDIHGWIKVKNTSLNYPVLQSKDNQDYLMTNFKNQKSRKGSIFADYRNNLNDLSTNTILYGHRIGNQTMFDVLGDYLNQDFYERHPKMEFDTQAHAYTIKVISAYKTSTKDNYIQTHFKNKGDYQKFLSDTKEKSKIHTQTSVNTDDKIITLSTCEDAFSQSDKRVVVVGKLIKER